jgi:hypothetical protein
MDSHRLHRVLPDCTKHHLHPHVGLCVLYRQVGLADIANIKGDPNEYCEGSWADYLSDRLLLPSAELLFPCQILPIGYVALCSWNSDDARSPGYLILILKEIL